MSAPPATASFCSRECPDITIKVASNRDERFGAFQLAYNSYHRAGLCSPCATELRITPYQLLPTTDVLLAKLRGEVISTLSLVRDGELGLPLESIYPAEVNARRTAGLRLAEVSCLADRRKTTRFFELFCELARLTAQIADRDGVDQLLIAVHPRHARMYARAMCFVQMGDHRDYPEVNGHPAVPMCLDFAVAKTRRAAVWRRFVGEPLPAEVTQPQPISLCDRRHFGRLIRRCAWQAERNARAVHPGRGAASGSSAGLRLRENPAWVDFARSQWAAEIESRAPRCEWLRRGWAWRATPHRREKWNGENPPALALGQGPLFSRGVDSPTAQQLI